MISYIRSWLYGQKEIARLRAVVDRLEAENGDLKALSGFTPESAKALIDKMGTLAFEAVTGKKISGQVALAMSGGPKEMLGTMSKLVRHVLKDALSEVGGKQ